MTPLEMTAWKAKNIQMPKTVPLARRGVLPYMA